MADPFPADEEFHESKISGKNYSQITIENRDFDNCIFMNCSMEESVFQSCRFRDCTFEGCNMDLAKFEHCRFQNTTFLKTRLVGIDWTALELRKKELQLPFHFFQCKLSYGNFFECPLKGCTFSECLLQEADFAEADLSKCNFQRSDLLKARFLHTNLSDTDFSGAKNYDINAANNVLKRTKFSLPEATALLHSLDIILDE